MYRKVNKPRSTGMDARTNESLDEKDSWIYLGCLFFALYIFWHYSHESRWDRSKSLCIFLFFPSPCIASVPVLRLLSLVHSIQYQLVPLWTFLPTLLARRQVLLSRSFLWQFSDRLVELLRLLRLICRWQHLEILLCLQVTLGFYCVCSLWSW